MEEQTTSIWPLLLLLVAYAYVAYSFQIIAKKTNTPGGWMAWVPIANCFLMLKIAGKPAWWFILLLIPIANIVVTIITIMEIAKKRNKPAWVGILMLVPVVNIFIPGYLAFSQ